MFEFFFSYSEKYNRRIRKQFGKLMGKLGRTFTQGRVTCTAQMENAPEFLVEEWTSTKSSNTVEALKQFLESYTELLHVGCYRRFDKIKDKVLGRFTSRL